MKILIDFFPILLFFGAYKFYDIYVGTAVLMGATVIQMALIYGIDRKLQAMHKITLVLILGFGSLTLALHDDRVGLRVRRRPGERIAAELQRAPRRVDLREGALELWDVTDVAAGRRDCTPGRIFGRRA